MSSPDDTATGVDRRALLAVLLGVALATLDSAICNTALPLIAADLRTLPAASIWVINAYQLAVVATLLPFAALGDKLGPRRIHLGGLAFFTLASVACALADTLGSLTAARALQGIGAGAMMSVNVALIRQIYPAARLGRGVGLNALVVGACFAAGPTAASLVLSVASWHWLFAVNLPLGAIALVYGWRALPRTAPRGHPFDPLTAALTGLSFAALIGALGSAAPAQTIVRRKNRRRQIVEQTLQRQAAGRVEAHLRDRVLLPEDAGQHDGGVTRGQHPAVRLPRIGGQVRALVQRHRDPLRVHEQIVFRQEPREQHPMPLHIRHFIHESGGRLHSIAPLTVRRVAQPSCFRTQTVPQDALLGGQGRVWLCMMHSKPDQRGAGRLFRLVAGGDYRALQEIARLGGQ